MLNGRKNYHENREMIVHDNNRHAFAIIIIKIVLYENITCKYCGREHADGAVPKKDEECVTPLPYLRYSKLAVFNTELTSRHLENGVLFKLFYKCYKIKTL